MKVLDEDEFGLLLSFCYSSSFLLLLFLTWVLEVISFVFYTTLLSLRLELLDFHLDRLIALL